MTDDELQSQWPELGAVVSELRRIGQSEVADKLVDAASKGTSSSEIVGNVGIVLRDHDELRPQLGESAIRAWDAILGDVRRVFSGSKFAQWLARLTG
jgi:hypothetical protein